MYTSLDTQGRLSARLLSAQARSACLFFLLLLLFYSQGAYAHGVAEGDKGYIQEITGVNIIPFIYLGAKHMVTGYDHLLFLFGVIFFLYKMRSGCTLACSLSGIQRRCSSAPSLISASVLTLLTPLSGCPWSIKRLITSGHSSAGLAFSPTRSLRRSSLDSSTVLVWQPKSRNSKSLPMACLST